MSFSNEKSAAEILESYRTENATHLTTSYLYSVEPLRTSEFSHPTLRINNEITKSAGADIRPGTIHDGDIDRTDVYLSYEPGELFPDDPRAHAVLVDDTDVESGRCITHSASVSAEQMFDYEEKIEQHDRESEITGIDLTQPSTPPINGIKAV